MSVYLNLTHALNHSATTAGETWLFIGKKKGDIWRQRHLRIDQVKKNYQNFLNFIFLKGNSLACFYDVELKVVRNWIETFKHVNFFSSSTGVLVSLYIMHFSDEKGEEIAFVASN